MKPRKQPQAKTTASPKDRQSPSPFQVAAAWPHQESPLLLSMVGGKQIFIATSFTPIDFARISDLKVSEWCSDQKNELEKFKLPRWLVILPYEAYSDSDQEGATSTDRTLAWEVYAGLTWEIGADTLIYCAKPDAKVARFHMEEARVKEVIKSARELNINKQQPVSLTPTNSDETYLETVQKLIRSIDLGDFYQINLLRYFHASAPLDWINICALMDANSGPHGVLIALGHKIVASFSPERFIEIRPIEGQTEISTWPIKGTVPRNLSDPRDDVQAGKKLAASTKDLAELHMIIDLMRNDFAKICLPGSVNVVAQSALKKFTHVWHLEGQVTGILNDDQTLNSILKAVCPGGSITGAPKIAAMRRIKLEEGRQRGYFMGNFFRINYDGSLESNIMIRTLVSDNHFRSATYAAGSGIVIKSDPYSELQEINAKCAPLTMRQTTAANRKSMKEKEDE